MNSPLQRSLLHSGLILLLLWSALESGGRYLFGQTLAQVLCGGLILLLALTQLRTGLEIQSYPLLGITAAWLLSLLLACVFSVNRLASLEEFLRYLMCLS